MNTTYAAHIVTAEANLGDPEIIVMTQVDDGSGAADVIVRYPLAEGADFVRVLRDNGWSVGLDDEDVSDGYTIVTVDPVDVEQIAKAVTFARDAAAAEYERCDTGWRTLIRDAMNDGESATKLAAATGVSRERIYQIRDGRR